MPKIKRWQNLNKLVQAQPMLPAQANAQPTTSQPVSLIQATRQLASSVQASSQPVPSIQVVSQPAPSIQAASQSTSSDHASSQSTSSNQDESQPQPYKKLGRESNQYWTVDTIDSEENIKKLKVKVKEVLNLSGKDRIVLDFDYLDSPFGEAQPLLTGFCGILAADSSLFPIHFEKWWNLPISYFHRVFDQIIAVQTLYSYYCVSIFLTLYLNLIDKLTSVLFLKPRFYFRTVESVAQRYVYNSISKKWSANRLRIWEAFHDHL